MNVNENFEYFQHSNFETDFLENENFFQKSGVPFFGIISIQKTAISEERSFASNYCIFLFFLFQFKNLL